MTLILQIKPIIYYLVSVYTISGSQETFLLRKRNPTIHNKWATVLTNKISEEKELIGRQSIRVNSKIAAIGAT